MCIMLQIEACSILQTSWAHPLFIGAQQNQFIENKIKSRIPAILRQTMKARNAGFHGLPALKGVAQ